MTRRGAQKEEEKKKSRVLETQMKSSAMENLTTQQCGKLLRQRSRRLLKEWCGTHGADEGGNDEFQSVEVDLAVKTVEYWDCDEDGIPHPRFFCLPSSRVYRVLDELGDARRNPLECLWLVEECTSSSSDTAAGDRVVSDFVFEATDQIGADCSALRRCHQCPSTRLDSQSPRNVREGDVDAEQFLRGRQQCGHVRQEGDPHPPEAAIDEGAPDSPGREKCSSCCQI